DPPFKPAERQSLGFNHPICGKLLCPVNMDWNDASVRDGLCDGTIKAMPADFPHFLYEGEVPDPEDLFDGWLKGDLLVCAYLHVFISPRSAINGSASTNSTRVGNAGNHGITTVSVASIAYVATIVSVRSCRGFINTHTALLGTLCSLVSTELQQGQISWKLGSFRLLL
ncbi:hypothetical protein BV22DRAFT_1023560, partial [Leucogyrophana mollusca]